MKACCVINAVKMKKHFLFLIVLLTGLPVFGASVQEIVSRQQVVFNAPPSKIPVPYATDAILLGNGSVAAALAGQPNQQRYYITRNDFWRLKSAYDESFPCLLGTLTLDIPELEGAAYSVRQDLWTASSIADFTKNDTRVTIKSYVPATRNALVVEIKNESDQSIRGAVKLAAVSKDETNFAFPSDIASKEENGVQYVSRTFSKEVDMPSACAAATRVITNGSGHDFSIPKGETAVIVTLVESNFSGPKEIENIVSSVKKATSGSISEWKGMHEKWWREFWEKSYVEIPDSDIERQYYVSLYGMASCSRDLRFPPGIFGSWITKEPPYWNADYHLNYNYNAPFYGLYSSNRLEQADSYDQPFLDIIERGEYYSKKITGIEGGILLPVGIGPLGMETTRENQIMREKTKFSSNGNVEAEGLFFGQKSNSAYGVTNMATRFYLTCDKAYAEKIYPYVKGVAVFWQHYLRNDNGRYVIDNDAIHEGTLHTFNPILSLGLVRMVLRTAADMAEFLGKDTETRVVWNNMEQRIADYPTQERDGKTIFRYTEKGIGWNNGNTLGIQHIFPSGQIGLDSPARLLEISRNTIEAMNRWKDYNGTNSFFPAAVRVGYNPDIIFDKLKEYSTHTYPNGFQKGNPHGIENFSTVPNTINEMYCSNHQNILRIFPVWNKNKPASFHNIRVRGAFLVSSSIKDGVVQPVTLKSEQGFPCTMVNPWGEGKVKITSNKKQAIELSGERITFGTEKGEVLMISPL